MLVKKINKVYWIIGVLLYLFFAYNNIGTREQLYFYIYSFVAFFIFGITIHESFKRNRFYFTKQNLTISVLLVSLIQVIILSLLSYSIDGDLFLFSKIDSIIYYDNSLKMSKMSFSEGIYYVSHKFSFDDWGAFIWFSTLFRISESLFFIKLVHVIIGVISSLMIFDIGCYLMPRRYAYMASLTFCIASFTAVLHVAFLKETIFTFLIISAFYAFYRFLHRKNILYLIVVFFLSALVAIFRLPVALILIFAFVMTLIVMYTKRLLTVVLGVVFSVIMITSSYFALTYERYLRAGNVEEIIERKEELSMGGGFVNHIADPLAAFIGPFPSIAVKNISKTSLYAPSLLYRVLLAAPFFLGAFYIVRYKKKELYPLVLFFMINAIGVAISVKGLEYRITHPHLAMAYIVAFWWLAQYDYKRLPLRLPSNAINVCFLIVFALSLIWNLR